MKRVIGILIILLIMTSCSMNSADASNTYEEHLKNFSGQKTVELLSNNNEGSLSWEIELEIGVLEIYYSSGLISNELLLTVPSGKFVVGTGGYRDGKSVKLILRADKPVTGRVNISTN